MTLFIVLASVFGYLCASAVTVGIVLAVDTDDWSNDKFLLGILSLFWPIGLLGVSLYKTGKYAHDRAIASRERKALPQARVVTYDHKPPALPGSFTP